MNRLILATNNIHKISEIKGILSGEEIEILSANDFKDFPLVEETGATLEENAVLKVRTAWSKYRISCLADDTGLEVDYLDGAPGVHSARFAGQGCSYADNNSKLLTLLDGIPPEKRKARFRTVIAFIDLTGKLHSVDGILQGSIAFARRGTYGFGYDPIFIVSGTNRTLAEFFPDEKNQISHRSLALSRIRPILIQTLAT